MKSLTLVPIVLSLLASSVFAQSNHRDAIIEKLESTYMKTLTFSPESPLVKNMLAPATMVNPGVGNEVWAEIAKEVAPGLSNAMLEKGGLMDTFFRHAVEPLSETELRKLEAVFTDPTYLKFQAAMNSPAAQRQVMQGLMGAAMKMNTTINNVLVKHGLKEVH
jgi:hypothetical protein